MSNIKLFESKKIRSVWNETEKCWYFVVSDVIQILTDTPNPSDYIKKMRKRDSELAKGWGQIVPPPYSRNCWWQTKNGLCQYKRIIADNSINSVTKSRTF